MQELTRCPPDRSATGTSEAFATSWKLTLITLCIASAALIVMGSAGMLAASYEQKIIDILS
jgi:hypothetical protein